MSVIGGTADEPIALRIDEVAVEEAGRVAVRPDPQRVDEDYFHLVYRAGQDVSWEKKEAVFVSIAASPDLTAERFAAIVAATRQELALKLVIDSDTRWRDVPAELKDAMIAVAQRA